MSDVLFDSPTIAPTKPEFAWQVVPETTPAPKKIAVVKFGGSFAVLENGRLNIDYFEKEFFPVIAPILLSEYSKIGLVVGGGNDARKAQENTKGDVIAKDRAPQQNMWQNAEILRRLAQSFGLPVVGTIPRSPDELTKFAADLRDTLVASWIKEGQSSDGTLAFMSHEFVKVLAESTDPTQILVTVVILSDVDSLYNANPKTEITARPIRYSNLTKLVKEKTLLADIKMREPGMKVPMTPESVDRWLKMRDEGYEPTIYYGHGKNISAVRAVLLGEDPTTLAENEINGTMISPDFFKTRYYNHQIEEQKAAVG